MNYSKRKINSGSMGCIYNQIMIKFNGKLSHLQYHKMGFIDKIIKFIPRPFKFIQRKLDIQKQWLEFKVNLRPHRYKLTFGSLILFYPLYSSYLHQATEVLKRKISKTIQQSTQPTQPAFQWTQNLIKHLLEHIFSDPRVKQQGLDFLFALLKDEKFLNNILQLLVSALQSKQFMAELKLAIKQILVQQLNDPEVRTSLNQFLINLSKNEQVKNAFIHLIQQVFSSKESQQTIISLLKHGVTNQQVKQALGESVNFAVREVLSDQQTLNQLKIFIFFLLRKFQNDDQIKGMMDILFAKGLGLVKKKKQPQLDKFLKPKKADIS